MTFWPQSSGSRWPSYINYIIFLTPGSNSIIQCWNGSNLVKIQKFSIFVIFSAAILNLWNWRKLSIIKVNLDIGLNNPCTKSGPNPCILSTFRGLTDESGVIFICDLELEPRSQKGHPQNSPGLHYLLIWYDSQICNGIIKVSRDVVTN